MKNFSDHLLAHRQQNYCFPFRFSNDSPQVFQWQKSMDNLNISCFPTKSQQQIMRKANLRVKWRAGKGRCLVASRDINPLELIMFDAAIVTGPQVLRSSSLLAPPKRAKDEVKARSGGPEGPPRLQVSHNHHDHHSGCFLTSVPGVCEPFDQWVKILMQTFIFFIRFIFLYI